MSDRLSVLIEELRRVPRCKLTEEVIAEITDLRARLTAVERERDEWMAKAEEARRRGASVTADLMLRVRAMERERDAAVVRLRHAEADAEQAVAITMQERDAALAHTEAITSAVEVASTPPITTGADWSLQVTRWQVVKALVSAIHDWQKARGQ